MRGTTRIGARRLCGQMAAKKRKHHLLARYKQNDKGNLMRKASSGLLQTLRLRAHEKNFMRLPYL